MALAARIAIETTTAPLDVGHSKVPIARITP
jgi:hypothetical protein